MPQTVILSAEDNPANRRIIRDLFGKKGYTILEATNGEEAVALAEREKPDLILMDIQLPKLSGYDAARTIKERPELQQIPIIAVTSYALSGDDRRAFEAGCDDYIVEPLDRSELAVKLKELLKFRHLRRRASRAPGSPRRWTPLL